MERISSPASTILSKRIYPGFALLVCFFVIFGSIYTLVQKLTPDSRFQDFPYVGILVPLIVFSLLAVFLCKSGRARDYLDEVLDYGDHFVLRRGKATQNVTLSEIESSRVEGTDRHAVFDLKEAGKFGKSVRFYLPVSERISDRIKYLLVAKPDPHAGMSPKEIKENDRNAIVAIVTILIVAGFVLGLLIFTAKPGTRLCTALTIVFGSTSRPWDFRCGQ